MGWFDAIDKLANAGARSTMPAEKHAAAKGQASNTNTRNQLADRATGGSVSRAERDKARADLVREFGGDARKADQLIKQSAERHRRGFRR